MSVGNVDVYALVRSCANANPADPAQYMRDQQQLRELYTEPGFYLTLQEIAADRNLSRDERLLASILTGRELKTKWRSKVLVPEARKPEVRERLFSFLEEPDPAIARPQLGLLVAVARIELPKHFPNLPQLLLNPLLTCLSTLGSGSSSSNTTTVLLNTLWTINALVKEYLSVKVASGVEVMRKFEEVFYEPVGQVLQVWADKEREGADDWVIAEAGRYAFKILARFGQWHWHKAKGLQTETALSRIHVLVHHSVHHAPIIQAHRHRLIAQLSQINTEEQLRLAKSLAKHIRVIGKWWRVMIGTDPKGFCRIDGSVQGIGWWWGEVGSVVSEASGALAEDDSDTNPHPKRFLLLGMMLFKDILPILAQEHKNVFTPDFILTALHLLVDKLLPLTAGDLAKVEEDPEEWLVTQGVDEEAWPFEFRPCAERVLISLTNACRHLPSDSKVIEPEMLKILAQAEATSPTDLPSILRREAVYCAMGRLARALIKFGGVDFNGFLLGASRWIGQTLPLLRILKRRLAWVIGEWTSIEAEAQVDPMGQGAETRYATIVKLDIVWQILTHLLTHHGEDSDVAVRLSTALAIKSSIDITDVDMSFFIPHMAPVTDGLIKLFAEAETLGGKRFVNDTLSVIIDVTGDKIMPFLPALASSIPTLWHGSAEMDGEWLFKGSLVALTTKLVSTAKGASGGLMDLVIPLIEESLVSPAKDHFQVDGLMLWQASLYNSESPYQPSPDKGLIRLFPGLLQMVSENLDLCEYVLPLLDSYMLLDGPGIFQSYGANICNALVQALKVGSKMNNAVRRMETSISLLVRVVPLPTLAPVIIETGLFQHVIAALENDTQSGVILAAYLDVLARIVLADASMFLQIVFEAARVMKLNDPQVPEAETVLEQVLDSFWRNFDYVGETRTRKAVAMAAATLLTTGHRQCLERLDGEFLNIFLDVLGECRESTDEATGKETAVQPWQNENSTEWGEIGGTPEGHRRLALEDSDPAYTIPLKAYIVESLTRAQGVGMGPYWDKADQGARHSLERFLS